MAGTLVLVSVSAGATTTLDELTTKLEQAWGGQTQLLAEVYASDGVHTATFHDKTNTYQGPEAIEPLAGLGWGDVVGPRIELPAADGQLRWVSFGSLAGGTACLWHAVDGLVERHDCVVPGKSSERNPRAGVDEGAPSAMLQEVLSRLAGSWGSDSSVERLAEIYAPDAVHSARFLDATRTYTGPEEIIRVARAPVTIKGIGAIIEFEAPEGELAWAEVENLAGGTVCLFRAVDGMITRHDCVLPI